ncbi:MAG: hypothetical protein WDO56_25670 [Gammaproteobacteria bacterium]
MHRVTGVFVDRRGERVDPRGSYAGLLQAVVVDLRPGANAYPNRAIDEALVAARADVSLDEADARIRLDVEVEPRI